ncbi:MAG: hypothetical protein RL414_1264, partial [Actinomycetota bacterium]
MAIKKPSLPSVKTLATKRKKSATPRVVENLGLAGAPIDRGHPFYFGFVAAAGALISLTLLRALA